MYKVSRCSHLRSFASKPAPWDSHGNRLQGSVKHDTSEYLSSCLPFADFFSRWLFGISSGLHCPLTLDGTHFVFVGLQSFLALFTIYVLIVGVLLCLCLVFPRFALRILHALPHLTGLLSNFSKGLAANFLLDFLSLLIEPHEVCGGRPFQLLIFIN